MFIAALITLTCQHLSPLPHLHSTRELDTFRNSRYLLVLYLLIYSFTIQTVTYLLIYLLLNIAFKYFKSHTAHVSDYRNGAYIKKKKNPDQQSKTKNMNSAIISLLMISSVVPRQVLPHKTPPHRVLVKVITEKICSMQSG